MEIQEERSSRCKNGNRKNKSGKRKCLNSVEEEGAFLVCQESNISVREKSRGTG